MSVRPEVRAAKAYHFSARPAHTKLDITLVVFIAYGILASSVRKRVADSPRVIVWLRRSFAATFAALGIKLAATDQ